MARDRLTEIAAARSRKGQYGARSRAESAVQTYHSQVFGDDPLFDRNFAPIRLVTALEVFVRETVAALIDAGDPYIDHARGLVKDLKFDFDITRALVGKTVSFGELASHVISLNSIADIDNAITQLTGRPLVDLLDGVHDRWAVEIQGEPALPIVADVRAMKATLQRLFEARHVLVHEMPEEAPFAASDLPDFAQASLDFIRSMSAVVDHLLHGAYPLTQLEMNEAARLSAEAIGKELDTVLAKIDPKKRSKRLQGSQRLWEAFREGEATFISRMDMDRVQRGSIAPLIYWTSWESLTKNRLEWLNLHFDDRYAFGEEGLEAGLDENS